MASRVRARRRGVRKEEVRVEGQQMQKTVIRGSFRDDASLEATAKVGF